MCRGSYWESDSYSPDLEIPCHYETYRFFVHSSVDENSIPLEYDAVKLDNHFSVKLDNHFSSFLKEHSAFTSKSL